MHAFSARMLLAVLSLASLATAAHDSCAKSDRGVDGICPGISERILFVTTRDIAAPDGLRDLLLHAASERSLDLHILGADEPLNCLLDGDCSSRYHG